MSGLVIGLIVAAVLTIPVLGIVASLGIYGTRRYLAAAKTTEARSSVAAIARAAVAAYERESLVAGRAVHRLCGSAIAVPAVVPPGKKYQPSSRPGEDYNSGSATEGWTCLRFSVSMPSYYQYHYHAGQGYLVGSLNPGPGGFEAAAVGDLDADGDLSRFAIVGQIVDDHVVVSPSVYLENEDE